MKKSKENTDEKTSIEETKKPEKEAKVKKTKKLTQLEFEKKVVELADEGLTAEKIGEKLRKEGIHPREFNQKISKILISKNKYINPDLKHVGEKLEKIKAHYEKNRQDKRAMREKDRVFAQNRKLKKYFKLI